MREIQDLEQAIAALESQRAILGDAVVDASTAALHEKLAAMHASAPTREHGRGEQQRKLVTILFADIASSTQMSARLDPEDALAIMGGALENFEAVIRQHVRWFPPGLGGQGGRRRIFVPAKRGCAPRVGTPLSKDDSRALVEEILKKAPAVPQALRELVVSGAEGNPFYAEELIKILIDEQIIVPGEELWRVMPDRLVQVRVPPTLTGVLQARLDSLPPIEYETLQRASVIGRVFWDQAVASLGSTSPEHPVQPFTPAMIGAAVQNLHRRELVFRRELSAFAGADEYIFKHTMLRDVTYETVLKKQRRIYHAQTAQWLVESNVRFFAEKCG